MELPTSRFLLQNDGIRIPHGAAAAQRIALSCGSRPVLAKLADGGDRGRRLNFLPAPDYAKVLDAPDPRAWWR
jgi:hypothetical protein